LAKSQNQNHTPPGDLRYYFCSLLPPFSEPPTRHLSSLRRRPTPWGRPGRLCKRSSKGGTGRRGRCGRSPTRCSTGSPRTPRSPRRTPSSSRRSTSPSSASTSTTAGPIPHEIFFFSASICSCDSS
uniref:Uncharacterized protein n=1 Tax=Triticum urartu TaxID=4572 RepID=A0A8R7TLU7_TRIUA